MSETITVSEHARIVAGLHDELEEMRRELDRLANITSYKGNTISYIYDKAENYGNQVHALGRLFFEYEKLRPILEPVEELFVDPKPAWLKLCRNLMRDRP